MIEPTDEDMQAALVMPHTEIARTIVKLRVAEEALEKIAEHPGPFADEAAWYRKEVATATLHQIKGQSNEQAD